MLLDFDGLDALSKGWLTEDCDDNALVEEETRLQNSASDQHRRLIELRVAQRQRELEADSRNSEARRVEDSDSESDECAADPSIFESESQKPDDAAMQLPTPMFVGSSIPNVLDAFQPQLCLDMKQQAQLWHTRRNELMTHLDVAWNRHELKWLS
jgi:hypothetical protein